MPRLLTIILIIVLLPIPFFGASEILKNYSPYFNGNSTGLYILMSFACGAISCFIAYFIINKKLPTPLLYGGAALFLIGISITAVWGLGAEPDFSPAVLLHPEREHTRYALLFLNAILFAVAFVLIIRYYWNGLPKWHKAIVLFFLFAFAEMIWEFQHHFFLASHLQAWINDGKKAEAFMPHYTPEITVRICGLARFCQYATIAWLALILFQNSGIKKWVLIIIAVGCVAGLVCGISIFVLGYASFGKLKAFLIFFIPGTPFVLLYWTGLALLTKKQADNNISYH